MQAHPQVRRVHVVEGVKEVRQAGRAGGEESAASSRDVGPPDAGTRPVDPEVAVSGHRDFRLSTTHSSCGGGSASRTGFPPGGAGVVFKFRHPYRDRDNSRPPKWACGPTSGRLPGIKFKAKDAAAEGTASVAIGSSFPQQRRFRLSVRRSRRHRTAMARLAEIFPRRGARARQGRSRVAREREHDVEGAQVYLGVLDFARAYRHETWPCGGTAARHLAVVGELPSRSSSATRTCTRQGARETLREVFVRLQQVGDAWPSFSCDRPRRRRRWCC